MNWNAFIYMGGYAAFVWPSLGVVLAVLAWNAIAAHRLHARVRRDCLRRLAARDNRP